MSDIDRTSASEPLWMGAAAREATGGTGPEDWQATGITIDTRTLQPGDLFVALRGERVDGHDYLSAAARAGAAAALVEHPVPDAALAQLQVRNSLTGLEALARAARARSAARICAVTGSVGKTGTKETLRLVLSRQGETFASRGNLNNHIGAPLSLASLAAGARYAVFELGMNHSGEIQPLTRMVRPHVAVVTTVTAAHLGHFRDESEIADAKAEIFEGLEPGGTAVINADNPHFARLSAAARATGADIADFGRNGHRTKLIGASQDATGSNVEAEILGHPIRYRIGSPGMHWVMNSLAVLTTVQALGADLREAATTLAEATPPGGRGQSHRISLADGRTITLLDESYNASPAAMRAAFDVLSLTNPQGEGRRIAVLGDMLEMGDDGARLHANLALALGANRVDRVFTAGPLSHDLHDALPLEMAASHAIDAASLIEPLLNELHDGDVVLVKGSLSMGMKRIVEALLAHREPPSAAG